MAEVSSASTRASCTSQPQRQNQLRSRPAAGLASPNRRLRRRTLCLQAQATTELDAPSCSSYIDCLMQAPLSAIAASCSPHNDELQQWWRGQQAQQKELLRAARDGDLPACERLLAGGVPVDGRAYDGRQSSVSGRSTALMLAAEHGHDLMVCLLLAHGARAGLKDERGRTALERAAAGPADHPVSDSGARNRAAFLLLQANPDPEAAAAALCEAAYHGREDIVDLLLARGTPLTTSLLLAAKRGHCRIIERLLEAGAELDATDGAGQTALMLAVQSFVPRGVSNAFMQMVNGVRRSGARRTVQLLVRAGADLDAVDRQGRTALTLALAHGNAEVSDLLRSAGATVDSDSMDLLSSLEVST